VSHQQSLFPDLLGDLPMPVFQDGTALLALFYFFKHGFDHGALSLCIRHFRPLETIFGTTEKELKEFFSSHGHVEGYMASVLVVDPHHREQAFQYAQRQATILSTQVPGVLLTRTDSHFPKPLWRARYPVEWVFCHPGLLRDLPSPRVAVVGSRRSSAKQLDMAKAVARLVRAAGGIVVTGLAAGADAAAYEGVHDIPRSVIGVLGTGIRKIYPSNHKFMLDEMSQSGGFIVTELPPEFAGNRVSFILRNRIIASLSDLVVAVSGTYTSGTSYTIRFAHEIGVPIVSMDPDGISGITQLVQQLGGRHINIDELHIAIRNLEK
jgi:DNA protecting protein DprA